MKKYPILLLLPLLLGACAKSVQCPPFDETERSLWLTQEAGSTISFEQEADHSLVSLTVTTNKATEAYTEKPKNGGIGTYVKDCEADARIRMMPSDAPSAWIVNYDLSITSWFTGKEVQDRRLKYTIGDFDGGFKIFPTLSMYGAEANAQMMRDSIVDHLDIGGKLYDKVIIQTRSTADTAGKLISKVYLAPGYGIVGFVSKDRRYVRKY